MRRLLQIILLSLVGLNIHGADYTFDESTKTLTYTDNTLTTITLPATYRRTAKVVDVSRCQLLSNLTFENTYDSLKVLNVSNTQISSIRFASMPNLDTLKCQDCLNLADLSNINHSIRHINAQGCTSLMSIDINNTNISYLNTDECPNIQIISIRNAQNLETLTIPKSITTLVCNNTKLRTIDLSECTQLASFNVNNNTSLRNLIFPPSCSRILELELQNIALINLDLSSFTKLQKLRIEKMRSLSNMAIPNTLLELTIDSCYIRQLDLNNTPQLYFLQIKGTPCTLLNLNRCNNLQFYVHINGKITSNVQINSNIKNGHWGTICFPYTVSNYKDYMEAYTLSGYYTNEYGDASALRIREVEEDELKAGIPYIVYYKQDSISLQTSGSKLYAPIHSTGFYGSFIKSKVPTNSLFISNNKLHYADSPNIILTPFHAYITPTALELKGYYDNESGNNTREIIPITNGTTTDINNTIQDNNIDKKIFNLNGVEEKAPQSGKIYIMNGHKVIKL